MPKKKNHPYRNYKNFVNHEMAPPWQLPAPTPAQVKAAERRGRELAGERGPSEPLRIPRFREDDLLEGLY